MFSKNSISLSYCSSQMLFKKLDPHPLRDGVWFPSLESRQASDSRVPSRMHGNDAVWLQCEGMKGNTVLCVGWILSPEPWTIPGKRPDGSEATKLCGSPDSHTWGNHMTLSRRCPTSRLLLQSSPLLTSAIVWLATSRETQNHTTKPFLIFCLMGNSERQ